MPRCDRRSERCLEFRKCGAVKSLRLFYNTIMKKTTIRVALGEIKPNPNNPRIIKKDMLKKLQNSLHELPEMAQIRPIVVDENNIILGGNMRYQAMKANGDTEAEVVKVSGLTDEQKREFIIKDNVPFGEWDWDKLANEWDTDELEDWGLEVAPMPAIDLEDGENKDDQPKQRESTAFAVVNAGEKQTIFACKLALDDSLAQKLNESEQTEKIAELISTAITEALSGADL